MNRRNKKVVQTASEEEPILISRQTFYRCLDCQRIYDKPQEFCPYCSGGRNLEEIEGSRKLQSYRRNPWWLRLLYPYGGGRNMKRRYIELVDGTILNMEEWQESGR